MVSITSLSVTIPSTEPNSSTTKAKWVLALRNCSSAEAEEAFREYQRLTDQHLQIQRFVTQRLL
jgi:hypothetical protein